VVGPTPFRTTARGRAFCLGERKAGSRPGADLSQSSQTVRAARLCAVPVAGPRNFQPGKQATAAKQNRSPGGEVAIARLKHSWIVHQASKDRLAPCRPRSPPWARRPAKKMGGHGVRGPALAGLQSKLGFVAARRVRGPMPSRLFFCCGHSSCPQAATSPRVTRYRRGCNPLP